MSNNYCNTTQFGMLYDTRVFAELSDDTGAGTGNTTVTQFHLDCAASEFESVAMTRFSVPISNPPLLLTRLVAALAIRSSFGRRSDLPKGVQADVEWASRWLEDMRIGKVGIPGVVTSESPIGITVPRCANGVRIVGPRFGGELEGVVY